MRLEQEGHQDANARQGKDKRTRAAEQGPTGERISSVVEEEEVFRVSEEDKKRA